MDMLPPLSLGLCFHSRHTGGWDMAEQKKPFFLRVPSRKGEHGGPSH